MQTNRVPNILESLDVSFTLAVTTLQRGTRNEVTVLIMFNKDRKLNLRHNRKLRSTTTKSARAAARLQTPKAPTARKPPSHPAPANNGQTPAIPCPSKSAETPQCVEHRAVYKANLQDSKESNSLSLANSPAISLRAARPPGHH